MDWAFGRKEVWVNVPDHSNVEEWKKNFEAASKTIADRDANIERIQREEEAKGRKRLSAETAQRKHDQEVKKLEADRKKMEQKAQATKEQLIESTRLQLIRSTSGALDKFIRQLQTQVQPSINDIFNEQLQLLQQQVKIQLEEPLQAKLAQRQKIQELIEQGEEQIKLRHAELEQGLADVQSLAVATQDALNSTH